MHYTGLYFDISAPPGHFADGDEKILSTFALQGVHRRRSCKHREGGNRCARWK